MRFFKHVVNKDQILQVILWLFYEWLSTKFD